MFYSELTPVVHVRVFVILCFYLLKLKIYFPYKLCFWFTKRDYDSISETMSDTRHNELDIYLTFIFVTENNC